MYDSIRKSSPKISVINVSLSLLQSAMLRNVACLKRTAAVYIPVRLDVEVIKSESSLFLLSPRNETT